MRIGVYLGRYREADLNEPYAEGPAEFAQGLVPHLVFAMSKAGNDEEVVFYGDEKTLRPDLLEQLEMGEVLTEKAEGFENIVSAQRVFRVLPNGARCRVLFRVLPSSPSRLFGMFLDQVVLAFLIRYDRTTVLHSAANLGVFFPGRPQVINLFDKVLRPGEQREGVLKRSLNSFLRLVFSFQKRFNSFFICQSDALADHLSRFYGIDSGRVSVLNPGRSIFSSDKSDKFDRAVEEVFRVYTFLNVRINAKRS